MSISKTVEVLKTERLLLRPAQGDDLPAFHAIMSDPRAMRHWSTLPHESISVTRDWLQGMLHPAPNAADWVLTLNDRVIGKAGGYNLPEIGFILHPDHWGLGYVTEAMQTIIPELFAICDLPGLIADVDPLNTASLKLLAKLGFTETHRAVRTFNLGGVWADSVYLALPRPDLAHSGPAI